MSPMWLMLPLAVLAGLIVAWPWLRRRLPEEQRRRAANVAAYRSRLAEIDAEQQAGALDEDTAQSLRDEAGLRLLEDEPGVAGESRRKMTRHCALGGVLAIIPILIAVGWYFQAGSWRTASEIQQGATPDSVRVAETGQVEQMVAGLRADLKQHPGNAERWALLGRSEMVLKNYAASAKAYGQANQLSDKSNPSWLVAQGLAAGMASGHSLKGEPARLFAAALAVAPDNARALWYGGVAAAQVGDNARARKLWGTLAVQPNVPDKVRDSLDHQIALLGAKGEAAKADKAPKAVAGGQELNVHVRVASDLDKAVPADATLYVYAKAADGSPMPVVARRIEKPHFPLALTLDDSDAPMKNGGLEGHARLEVVARLSKSGDAAPASGDLQGSAEVDMSQQPGTVTITMGQKIP